MSFRYEVPDLSMFYPGLSHCNDAGLFGLMAINFTPLPASHKL